MKKTDPYPSVDTLELFEAILLLKNEKEAAAFFRDLLTMAEITEFTNRWQMVKMLSEGKSYLEIAETLNTSTSTVTRVAHWLHNGHGGYKTVADRMFGSVSKDIIKKKPFKLRGKYTFLPNSNSME